jgi:hypothetical protein
MSQPKVIDKKGMEAMFSGVSTTESVVGTTESLVSNRNSGVTKPDSGLNSKESGVKSPKYEVRGIDMSILNQAIKQGSDNPRISSWNPSVMAVLRYKNLTTPAYSMSKEISELLEIAVKEKYPELYRLATEEMEKND